MREQLMFDLMIMKEKKLTILVVVIGDLLYLTLGLRFFKVNPFYLLVATLFLTCLHIYTLAQTLSVHSNHLNQSVSNYASNIFFPTKRGFIFLSRALYTLLSFIDICILIVMLYGIGQLLHKEMPFSFVATLFLCALIGTCWLSGIMYLTSFCGRVASVGAILGVTMLGFFAGMISDLLEEKDRSLLYKMPTNMYLIAVVICIVFWISMLFLTKFISKKVTV